jgi:hypothetical protein
MSHPHTHSHADHDHAHPHARPAHDPAWSLLRLSAFGRVALAGGLLALLWLAVIAVMI